MRQFTHDFGLDLGVSVLQTSLQDTPAEEVFALYKKRWAIKTYFDYFKNG